MRKLALGSHGTRILITKQHDPWKIAKDKQLS
jgi:hypothetical protein